MPAEGRRRARVKPQLSVGPPERPRRVGPADLFAQVAPLLAEPRAGQDALERLVELLQEDPALIDLRLDEGGVVSAVRNASPTGIPAGEPQREALFLRVLPSVVPPRFGRELADAFASVSQRRPDPRDRAALALGRYLALLDDVEGAPGTGRNALWRALLELTWLEAAPAAEGREILHVPPESAELRSA